MNRNLSRFVLALACVLVISGTVRAHHSFSAAFD